jgi:putative endonuclease
MRGEPVFVNYILTNWNKTVLYVGMTNNLERRLVEHWAGKAGAFTTRYNVFYLVWWESTKYVLNAIESEKAIKRLTREQKNALITDFNPQWKFLNADVLGNWPPTPEQVAALLSQPLSGVEGI